MNPQARATICSQKEVIEGYFLMTLKVSSFFEKSLPGQFVMIRTESGEIPFLSRPLSIYSVFSQDDETFLELLYKVVGKGTEVFSHLGKGVVLHVLGPLGKGFDIPSSCKRIVLIAGGIGVAPLSFLALYSREQIPKAEVVCYLGAVSSGVTPGLQRLEKICSEVKISTDDGSRGYHGTVTDLFRQDLDRYTGDDVRLYSCGPRPMLRSLQILLKNQKIACQVSLEERMACGIGACLGCVVRTRRSGEGEGYARVCTEGPVFDIRHVRFDDEPCGCPGTEGGT